MNTQHDRLDDAIDAVAMRMTSVTADDAFATRILAALPDRSPWTLRWLMPRLAVTAALVAAASLIVLRMFDERSTDVLRAGVINSAAVEMAAAIPEHRTFVEPSQIVRRTTVEPPENDRRTVVDFDRSLEAIEAPAALSLATLAPNALPEDAPLTLAPLAIADLPTAESISPR